MLVFLVMNSKPSIPCTKVPPELKELSCQIGQFIEYWGFKKIHGQIWTHIFLASEPLDATTLAKRLNVSKALISLAIKDLLDYKVIEITGAGPRRKVLFRSNPNLIEVIVSVLRMRERKMLSEIMSSYKNLKKMTPDDLNTLKLDNEKTEELGHMIEMAISTLDMMISSDLAVPLEENHGKKV